MNSNKKNTRPSKRINEGVVCQSLTRSELKDMILRSLKKRSRKEIMHEIPSENGNKE